MSQFGVFVYCLAVGFVIAGTISSFYQWVTAERADFSMSRSGIGGVLLVVIISMFAGPFILVRKVVTGLRSHELSVVPAAIGMVLAGMWSTCAGIFVLSLVISA